MRSCGTEAPRRLEGGGIFLQLMVLLAMAGALTALAWMLFLPAVVTSQLRARTGFDATVERLSVNPFTGVVDLRGFVLTNPPIFAAKDFVQLREFHADLELGSLLSDQLVFETMTVDLALVALVKNREGATNAEVLARNLEPSAGAPRPPSPRQEAAKKWLVRKLALKIDRMVIVDRSGSRPSEQDFRLNLNQNYANVTEWRELLAPAALKDLAPVAVAATGWLPGDLGKAMGDATKSGAELLKEAGRKAEVKVKGFFDALEESKKP